MMRLSRIPAPTRVAGRMLCSALGAFATGGGSTAPAESVVPSLIACRPGSAVRHWSRRLTPESLTGAAGRPRAGVGTDGRAVRHNAHVASYVGADEAAGVCASAGQHALDHDSAMARQERRDVERT